MISLTKCLIFTTFLVLTITGCKQTKTVTQSALNLPSSCIIGKWSDSSLPLNLKMAGDFTGDFTAADYDADSLNSLEQMAKKWNTAATRTLITVPFAAATVNTNTFSSTSSFKDSEIGIYKSINWFSNVSSSALAITQFFGVVTSSPGLGQYIELTHADIIANYRDYNLKFTMPNNPAVEFDVPTVILHEMGHLLGLCHETKKPSIMAPYYLTVQRSLQAYDADLIKDIYVDGTISAFSVKNSNSNAISEPDGTIVRGIIELHKDGKCIHSVNGKKIYEHVIDFNK